jgi:fumarate reductase subunit C
MGMKQVHFATSNSLRCLPVLFHCIFFFTSVPQALQYQVGSCVSGMTQIVKSQLSHTVIAQNTLL